MGYKLKSKGDLSFRYIKYSRMEYTVKSRDHMIKLSSIGVRVGNKTLSTISSGGCWGFYVLVTYKVIIGQTPICNRVYSYYESLQLYSAAPLGNQSSNTMTRYPTNYPGTELTSPRPGLEVTSHWFNSTRNRTADLPHASHRRAR